jgi:hypothetical protein
MKAVPRKDWEWFGNAAHFCCGRWCRFHMATKVGPWLVSTVGEFVHPKDSGGSEQAEGEWLSKNWPGSDVGLGRKYETMVFKAGDPCRAPGCMCGIPYISGGELEMKGYNAAGDATRGHVAMCERWAKKQEPK